MNNRCVLILYTTQYRTGGDKFARAAKTLDAEKRAEAAGRRVICQAVESKADFLASIASVAAAGGEIAELHFIGHSGLYGIMFGSTRWPEQFSPFEWRQMKPPFAADACCYFHACRTGRWFAPFIARTLGVKAFGHYGYTTVSAAKARFRREGRDPAAPLYIISCPGRKSHGILASARKYLGLAAAVPMLEFSPTDERVDTTYDAVADLYDDVFADLQVRGDEWRWLVANLPLDGRKAVLDIGCGNGMLLAGLAGRLGRGVGVDVSAGMIAKARTRGGGLANLEFRTIDGPSLPFADDSFDAAVSLLSFRYLDWDPIVHEILRVLKPGGELFVVDMVAAPARLRDIPRMLRDKLRALWQTARQPGYARALRRMVRDPRWRHMLKYNPMRAEHEYRWYLESRFPGRRIEVLNVGRSSRIVAFRSGPIAFKAVQRLTYP